MNSLIVIAVAVCVASVNAGVIGHGGTIVSGPSGIVTDAGPIGPHGLGLGYGHGHGAVLAAPAVVAPVGVYGHGVGLGYDHGVGVGYGLGGGVVALGGHGVTVKGPATVPAVIAGPSGKIVADGLYGVPTHHGHWW